MTQPMDEEFSIGYWIKRRRKALDMTQKDLADRVGCALITIAKIEADQRKPSHEIAGLLAEHLNIPAEQRTLFIQVVRGLKSSLQLRRIGTTDSQAVQPVVIAPPMTAVPTSEASKLRGMELVGKISHSKLVGRSAEFVMAHNLWGWAIAGQSQVLIFQGEPGIGKSRLASELINEVKALGGSALVGECFSEGGMLYGPIVRILQNETSLPPDLPTVAVAELKKIAPHLAVHLSYIPANLPLDPQAEQLRLLESIYTYFRRYYEKNPLLILIEDVHWADHGSIAVLQSLVHRFRQVNAPVLMVLTTRDISPSTSPALNSLMDDLVRSHLSTTIHLDRFDQNGTRELLAAIFAQDITDEFIQFIQRETQGNPFFIEEVCKDLLESRQIYWDQGRWERKELTELRVPPNVRTAIQARLDKLGKETHELLQTASAIGRRFAYDVLRNIVAGDEEGLINRLEAAREAQIIQEAGHGEEFEFSHALIASVLLDGMSTPRRRVVYKRIVAALEKTHSNDFSLLAYHAREAGENEASASYFHKAGDQAIQTFAHEDAIPFYSEGLNFIRHDSAQACQILLARAKVYDLRGERSLQLADLEAAEEKAEAARDVGTRAAVALARAEDAIQMTEANEAIQYAQRAIALAEEMQLPAIAAQAYMLWRRTLLETGELSEARKNLLEAGRIARESGLGLIETRSMINLGNVDDRSGDFNTAGEKYKGSLDTLRKLGERRIECMVINNLGNVYWTQGDLEAATSCYKQSLEIARAIGDRLNEARGVSNIGSILTEQYQYQEALEMLERARPLLQEVGRHADESVLLGHLGDVMESLGRYDEACQYKIGAKEPAHKIDDPQAESEYLTGLSRIEIYSENYESAENFAQQAINVSQQQGYRVEESAAWQVLGFSQISANKHIDAEASYIKSLELYETLEQANKESELRAELAWLAHERGDLSPARKYLESLFPDREPATLANIQQPSICWCCYEVLKEDQPQAALKVLQNGRSTLKEVAEKIADPKAREHYLTQLPHHAELRQVARARNSKE